MNSSMSLKPFPMTEFIGDLITGIDLGTWDQEDSPDIFLQ